MAKAKVYLIGAGPGRSDLITVRGLEVLKQADVVIYDYLVGEQLARSAAKSAKLICSHDLGKIPYHANMVQAQKNINQAMVKEAKKGKKVVRLKNGDAAIFSRLSEEINILLANKIEFEIVPGVTAASAAAAYSGIPLTERGKARKLAFVTGHDSNINWEELVSLETIVIYMGVSNLKKIIKRLLDLGKAKNTPAVIITNAGAINQLTIKGQLKDLVVKAVKNRIKPPAIIIIGKTVGRETKFNWLRKNKRILFTGLSAERYFLKGTYFHLPLIKIEPLKDYARLDRWVKKLSTFNWLVFASRYGVDFFFEQLLAQGEDVRGLFGLKIAAVGQSTANRLLDFGIKADLVPKVESSDGLVAAFKKEKINGQLIFMPRSDLADKGLEQKISKLGAKVVSCVAYRNQMPKNLPDLDLAFFNEIMFTSPSTVRNFKKRYKKVPKGVRVSCIGDRTKQEFKSEFRR